MKAMNGKYSLSNPRKTILSVCMLMASVLLASCTPNQASLTPTGEGLANPASVYCEQNGGGLALRQDAAGGVAGVCIFPDGSECDEWAYYRGECKPGDTLATPESTAAPVVTDPIPTAAADIASDGCSIYRNTEFGYSFHYPADAEIVYNDDPLGGFTIVGPVIDGESWPVIAISHPRDREEYRPPEDVDLLQWLTDHYLLGEQQMPDVTIAGTTAIHLRHERSPQSYASDRYFFAREGQLYMIIISHAGDREDWELYNHFLESIQFE